MPGPLKVSLARAPGTNKLSQSWRVALSTFEHAITVERVERRRRARRCTGAPRGKAAGWFQPPLRPSRANYKSVLKSRRCSSCRTPRSENGFRKTTGIRCSTHCHPRANMARLGFQPPNAPGSRSNCGFERRECQAPPRQWCAAAPQFRPLKITFGPLLRRTRLDGPARREPSRSGSCGFGALPTKPTYRLHEAFPKQSRSSLRQIEPMGIGSCGHSLKIFTGIIA